MDVSKSTKIPLTDLGKKYLTHEEKEEKKGTGSHDQLKSISI